METGASPRAPIYRELDAAVNRVSATELGFTQLTAAGPYPLQRTALLACHERHRHIRAFFQGATQVLEAALANDLPPFITSLLLNETPAQFGSDFHRRVLDRRRTEPQFFRTDEVALGRIVEIQCPGSQWGEYELLRRALAEGQGVDAPSLAAGFIAQATELLGNEPTVHHLLDNSSAPHTTRYFIDCTRPQVSYFGIDPGLSQLECRLLRSHSFFGQAGENFFRLRLEQYLAGETLFDLPPLIIFDEKITLALPFLKETRDFFPDDVRDTLVYSTPLTPDGFGLPDGAWITLQKFAALPRARRRWFVKYAGSDVAINWGSRAVETLDNMGQEACLERLTQLAEGSAAGKIWIVQPHESHHEDIEYVAPDGETHTESMTAKFSNFYGPTGHLGCLPMHRRFYKVHGQSDTVISIAHIPQGPGNSC